MRKLSVLCPVVCLMVMLLVTSLAGCQQPLSLEISSPEDGAGLKVNLQKVTGTVSDPGATVVVNGIEAKVAEDGTYYAYIELAEGKNNIEAVAMRDVAKSTEDITVSFIPPLVVRYTHIVYPEPEIIVDYTKTPLPVTGMVTHPKAIVTVNGIEASVAADGSFSTQIPLMKVGSNAIKAVARLGMDEDDIVNYIILLPEGELRHPPGGAGGLWYHPDLEIDQEVMLKAGETKVLDATLNTGKMEPSLFTFTIGLVSREYAEELLPMPEGMKVSIEPSEFTAYPRTAYHFSIIIETTPELPSGEYVLLFKGYFGHFSYETGWIAVNVEP